MLKMDTYLDIEKQWKQRGGFGEQYKELGGNDEAKVNLLMECEHIHNKAVFDAVNEALLQCRPYGKDGEP